MIDPVTLENLVTLFCGWVLLSLSSSLLLAQAIRSLRRTTVYGRLKSKWRSRSATPVSTPYGVRSIDSARTSNGSTDQDRPSAIRH